VSSRPSPASGPPRPRRPPRTSPRAPRPSASTRTARTRTRTCSWPWPTASPRWRQRGTTEQVGMAPAPRGAAPAPRHPPAEPAVPGGGRSGSRRGPAALRQRGTSLPPKQSSGTAPCSERGAGVVPPKAGLGGLAACGWAPASPSKGGGLSCPASWLLLRAMGDWGDTGAGGWCQGWGSWLEEGQLPALAPGSAGCPRARPAPLSLPTLEPGGALATACACPGWGSWVGLSLLTQRGACMGSAWCLVCLFPSGCCRSCLCTLLLLLCAPHRRPCLVPPSLRLGGGARSLPASGSSSDPQ